MNALIRATLRGTRAALARVIAAVVERIPSIEPSFVRAGQSLARRSRVGGGLYWYAQQSLLQRLQRSGRRYRDVRVRNLALQLDVTDATGRYPFFYSIPYEEQVTDAVVGALAPGGVFIDVGANSGYFATLAARLVGAHGRVIAFEPHDGARTALEELARRNHVSDTIVIVPMALAEREADLTLYTTDEFTSYSTLDPERSPMREVVEFNAGSTVRATTLDAWLAANADLVPRVACIKIDVEGAEARVVAGMAHTLASYDGTIICETTIDSEADEALARAGFARRRLERGTSSSGNFLYVRRNRRPSSVQPPSSRAATVSG
jgi:FkbM family methyltransferase